MAGKPEKTVTITVNQDDHEVAKEKISYEGKDDGTCI